jgi:hypothetical protein
MRPRDRYVLWALQAVVLVLPLFLGGRHPAGLIPAWIVIIALLACTLAERRRAASPFPIGVAALAGFFALGLATALPLPPIVLKSLSPATFQLYADMLPGWPGGGGWTTWRSLALDPFAVWVELSKLAVGLGPYVVLVAYPWGDEAERERVFGRMFMTLLAGGLALAALGLLQEVVGNGKVLWITDESVARGRASGPFVNPNHLACWLELAIPSALAYAWVLGSRLRRRLAHGADSGRRLGLHPRRAWIAALIASQRRLVVPCLATTAFLLLVTAHLGTESRGGTAALLVGLGVTGAGIVGGPRATRRGRWLPAAVATTLLVGSATLVAVWATSEEGTVAEVEDVDVNFASRLAVAADGLPLVRDYSLLGVGLGSWIHAFPAYVGPPVEGGIWDHAHDEYLEVAAETGLAGAALVVAFALALIGTLRRRGPLATRPPATSRASGNFDSRDWREALADHRVLAWGLVGGVAAILTHSLVEFGLHMPANMMLLALVLGLLVLEFPVREAPRVRSVAVFTGLAVLAAVPLVWNQALVVAGAPPLGPEDALRAADNLLGEKTAEGPGRASVLAIHAIDRSPAFRDAYEMLAKALGPGEAGDDALRRALRLEPWYVPGRDDLAFRLWDRGEHDAAVAELEESMYRFPYLVSHAFLSPDMKLSSSDGPYVVRALASGDTTSVRLALLPQPMADAVERGLDRALAETVAGTRHNDIVEDRVALLEARERWLNAAEALRAEAERDDTDDRSLAHAARDYLQANDEVKAEEALLAGLLRNPERGTLYQHLAEDIYAARGDFPSAEKVLAAGELHAIDMLPIYDAQADVVTQREEAWAEGLPTGEPDEQERGRSASQTSWGRLPWGTNR